MHGCVINLCYQTAKVNRQCFPLITTKYVRHLNEFFYDKYDIPIINYLRIVIQIIDFG